MVAIPDFSKTSGDADVNLRSASCSQNHQSNANFVLHFHDVAYYHFTRCGPQFFLVIGMAEHQVGTTRPSVILIRHHAVNLGVYIGTKIASMSSRPSSFSISV